MPWGLGTARSIEDASSRTNAFSAIAEAQAKAGDIQGALSTAQSIGEDWPRANALSAIAQAMLTANQP